MEGFIIDSAGPDGLVGVFEDDGDTGYLYVYRPEADIILNHLHIYDRSPNIFVQPRDVRVLWSNDLSKCRVIIWEKMRGIIDVEHKTEGRVWLESKSTPGIGDPAWLSGFIV